MARVGWITAVLAFGTLLVAYLELLAPEDEWLHRASGFVAGSVVAGLVGVFAYYSYYREYKREAQLKKLELIRLIPSRAQQLENLYAERSLFLRDKLEAEQALAEYSATSKRPPWSVVPDWQIIEEAKQADQMKFAIEQIQESLGRLEAEVTRVEAMSNDEWLEQEQTRINVPK